MAAVSCLDSKEYNAAGAGKSDAGIQWGATSYTFQLGSEFVSPALINPNALEVTYKSSDETVATVSASGALSLLSVGVTTISASFAGDDSYRSATASYELTVSAAGDSQEKQEAGIAWPAESYSFSLEETFTSPVLTNPHALPVTYSSSKPAVATVSNAGALTLLKAGSTRITATFAGDDTYNSSSVSYSLTVKGTDDGSGEYTLSSADTDSSDDNIANTVFDRWITITFSSSGSAAVTGDYYGIVSVSGNHVTVRNSDYTNAADDLDKVIFELKGSTSDGSLTLYGTRKACLYLNGVSITNPSGAAINNQCKKRTFVRVLGTNALADGSSAAYTTTGEEDMKAVLFSEGQLIFSGDGTLTVTANNKAGKAGITSDDYLRFMSSPTVKVTSGANAGHGMRGKECVEIDGGNLTVSTSASMKKGVTSDSLVVVKGGVTTVTVSGSAAYDTEAQEYVGTACIKADYAFQMSGGTVTLTNSGQGGKGIRAGSHYDYSEKDHTLPDSFVSGGTLTIKTTGARYGGGTSSYTGTNALTGGNFVLSGGTVDVQCSGATAGSSSISSKGIKIGYKVSPTSTKAGPRPPGGGGEGGGSKGNECIEAKGTLGISGGDIYAYSTSDDAINSASTFTVSGGMVMGYSTANDGLDANGNMYLEGGIVYAITTKGTPEVALDANTEGGFKLYIKPGVTMVAYGGLERGYSATQTVKTSSCSANAWNGLYNGSSYIAAFKALNFSSVSVSAPSLSSVKTGVKVSGTTHCNGYVATTGIQ